MRTNHRSLITNRLKQSSYTHAHHWNLRIWILRFQRFQCTELYIFTLSAFCEFDENVKSSANAFDSLSMGFNKRRCIDLLWNLAESFWYAGFGKRNSCVPLFPTRIENKFHLEFYQFIRLRHSTSILCDHSHRPRFNDILLTVKGVEWESIVANMLFRLFIKFIENFGLSDGVACGQSTSKI